MKYLIVGLGNIGSEYENSRHNIGFKTLDAFAKASNVSFSSNRYADTATVKYKGRTFVLVKPTTYMNLSGKAVNYYLQEEKIPLERLLIITDDIALPFGTLRLKAKGSDGGHNGLKNINQILGRQDYPRLRFGVGNEFSPGNQVNYVLGEWDEEQAKQLPDRLEQCQKIIQAFTTIGIQRTMNKFNGK
ncbi:MAG: aminoacyl-tRNA hydrolase [Vicingaceae bacterium]